MTFFGQSQEAGAGVGGAAAGQAGEGEALCAWRVEIAGGVTGVPHRVVRDEVLMVSTGEVSVSLDGVAGRAGAGDVLVAPAGTEFRVDNEGTETVSAWVTTSAGFEATRPDGTTITPPWAS